MNLYSRANLIEAARGFVKLGTPFRHQGRDCGGIDCIGMLGASLQMCRSDIYERLVEMAVSEGRAVVFSEDEWKRPTYDVNDVELMDRFVQFAAKLKPLHDIRDGDFLLFNFNGQRTFCGISSHRNGLPHLLSCFSMSRRATERHLNGVLRQSLYAAYDLRGAY